MQVVKRNGTTAPVSFDKIDLRNRNLARPDLIVDRPDLMKISVHQSTRQLPPLEQVDTLLVSKEVMQVIYDGVTTVELDIESARIAQSLGTHNPQYAELASRIFMSNYHKNNIYDLAKNLFRTATPSLEQRDVVDQNLFLTTATALWNNTDRLGKRAPLIAPHVFRIIQENAARFDELLDYNRDFSFDFIGMNMLEKTYLLKANLFDGEKMHRVPIERPQHLIMRVAIGIHCSTEYVQYGPDGPMEEQFNVFSSWLNSVPGVTGALTPAQTMELFTALLPKLRFPDEQRRFNWADYDISQHSGELTDEQWVKIVKTYEIMSGRMATHATPTLFNAGTLRPQCSSCYLIMLFGDSLEGISKLFNACMHIQKWAGGIGTHCHNIRAEGAYIRGTNGTSNGIGPYARVLDAISVYIDQCFHPDTVVITKSGIKNIGDVVVGDKLMTHDGTFQKVLQVLQHDFQSDENTLAHKIEIMHALEPVLVTGKHPVYALKQRKGVNYKTVLNRLEKGYIKPEYTNVEDLTDEYLVGIPIPTYERDRSNYDVDDCYMYGLMLGDGSISADLKTYAIYLNDDTKSEQVDFVIDYLNGLGIDYYERTENNCHRIVWYRNVLFPFTRAMLYDSDGEKMVHHTMLHLPKSKTMSIVCGLLDSDGSIGKEIMIELTSRNVIESIRYMLLRQGIATSGYIRDRVGNSHEIRPGETITHRKKTYVVRIPFVPEVCNYYPNVSNGRFLKYFVHDGMVWSRVKSNTPQEYGGVMIDFEMENNENYLTHMGLVHNGGNKRPGSHAMYLEPWHGDIFTFLQLRKHRADSKEENTKRARGLFYAMWNCDEFMWRVENDMDWYLMCPDSCPGLSDAYNQTYSPEWVDDEQIATDPGAFAFSSLYRKYIADGKYLRKVRAVEVWNAITELQTETGLPYMMYKDNVNRKNNQANLGTIKSSNLCVAPDTLILTKQGQIQIKDLVNQEVEIWNGFQWSKVTPTKTGENQRMWKVEFSNGVSLMCTKYHKFYTQEGYKKTKILKRTHELEEGMKLIKYKLPKASSFTSNEEFPHAYTHGAFCADGTYDNKQEETWKCEYQAQPDSQYCKRHSGYQKPDDEPTDICQAMIGNSPRITLYGYKKELIDYLDIHSSSFEEDNNGRINVCLPKNLRPKFDVPLKANVETKLSWLEGYLDFDGTVTKNGSNLSLQVGCIHREFLLEIKLMLQTMGIDSKVTLSQKARWKNLPNGKGGTKKYFCQALYRLLINSSNLYKLIKIGFAPIRLEIGDSEKPQRDATQFVKILSVEETDQYSDTYCFNEPKKHMGLFNGVLTGNCTEIVEYTSPDEVAVCNLASICLPAFVEEVPHTQANDHSYVYNCSIEPGLIHFKRFNMEKFMDTVRHMAKNLDQVIDINYYPIPETKRSNLRHRPIGLGVQGTADLFAMLRMPFDSQKALELNYYIHEALYFAALTASNEMAVTKGTYETFVGSPASKGLLQFDLSEREGAIQEFENMGGKKLRVKFPRRQNWAGLKAKITKSGLRNSLLVAPMPTASTSYIMGNSPCFEPFNSNVFKRANKCGEFVVVNKLLIEDLIELGIWGPDLKKKLMLKNGRIQEILEIPKHVRELYKTAWDMSPKAIILQAITRAPFVDQSQSMNLFIQKPSPRVLTQVHFFTWRRGLKTGSYYIHSRPPVDAQKLQIADEGAANLVQRSQRRKTSDDDDADSIEVVGDACFNCGS